MSKHNHRGALFLSFLSLAAFAVAEAAAQRGGGGGGRGGGSGAQASRGGGGGGRAASTPAVRSSSNGSIQGASSGRGGVNGNRTANANTNTNRNVNRNTNRNVNRNVDVDVDNGWGGYGYGRPVAAGMAVAATTAVVMGSYYSALPGGCTVVPRATLTYHRCGSTWYQPVYQGMDVQYQVVAEP